MSNPVMQTASQALTGAGYNTFAIASGPDASRQAVALYHHPDCQSRDLPIDGWALFRTDAHDEPSFSIMKRAGLEYNDANIDHCQSQVRSRYNRPWGNIDYMQLSSKNVQKITLTVDARQPHHNLARPIVAALRCSQGFNRLQWSLSGKSFSLAETAALRSSLLAIRAHWNSESVQGPEIVYYPVYRDPALFTSAAEILSDIFGADQVEIHGE